MPPSLCRQWCPGHGARVVGERWLEMKGQPDGTQAKVRAAQAVQSAVGAVSCPWEDVCSIEPEPQMPQSTGE